MLVHTWESQKPLLHDIQGKVVYDLDPVMTVVKMQTFCEVSQYRVSLGVGSVHRLHVGCSTFFEVWRTRKQRLEYARIMD